MLRAQGDDLEPFDSEIERTFRRRRREYKQKQQHQMADNLNNPIPIQPIGQMAARNQQQEQREVNEGDLPVSMFFTPIAAPARSSIVYPEFGVNNFQIRADWINLMSNTL
jgi:hypothetical protein